MNVEYNFKDIKYETEIQVGSIYISCSAHYE